MAVDFLRNLISKIGFGSESSAPEATPQASNNQHVPVDRYTAAHDKIANFEKYTAAKVLAFGRTVFDSSYKLSEGARNKLERFLEYHDLDTPKGMAKMESQLGQAYYSSMSS